MSPNSIILLEPWTLRPLARITAWSSPFVSPATQSFLMCRAYPETQSAARGVPAGRRDSQRGKAEEGL